MQAAVLGVLRRQGAPLGAYELLGRLRRSNPKLAPPTIYRALASLTDQGRVHRIESLNAFVACRRARDHAGSVMAICDDCGAVEETLAPDLLAALSGVAGRTGFAPTRHVIEIHGLCASCGAGGAGSPGGAAEGRA